MMLLQEAQKMVDFILRHGNDLLAIECLRGYEVSTVYVCVCVNACVCICVCA